MFNIRTLVLLLLISANCFGITPMQQRKNFNNTIVSTLQAITKKQVAIAQKRLALATKQLKSIKDPKFKKAQLLVLAKLKVQLNKISKSKKKATPKKTMSAYQKEYIRLLKQCQALKTQYLNAHSFEHIRQKALEGFQNTMSTLDERFGFRTGGLPRSDGDLRLNLDAQEVYYNIELQKNLANHIATFLRNTGSPVAPYLWADIISSNFLSVK